MQSIKVRDNLSQIRAPTFPAREIRTKTAEALGDCSEVAEQLLPSRNRIEASADHPLRES